MQYLAIIGDFIDSKSFKNRYNFQQQFQDSLEKINQSYHKTIVSKFSITLGDEFQGLLTNDAPIFQIIDDLNRMMSPYQLRYGIGLGEILTKINPEISIGADGPAYWKARQAITEVHVKNDYGQTHLLFQSSQDDLDFTLNSLLAAGEAIKSNWRTSQEEVFYQLLKENIYSEDFNHLFLAEKLELDPSALSKRLKSSSIKVYLRSRRAALTLIQSIEKE
ncbi:SatD family protein [Streptococcus catagoni]|uniref:SatD family protein n=1 Tax=Streptococcus catagoni TaxID=2654874 RepID=UPI001407416E|nr:SatD family protein [Streptococcus catagoni]